MATDGSLSQEDIDALLGGMGGGDSGGDSGGGGGDDLLGGLMGDSGGSGGPSNDDLAAALGPGLGGGGGGGHSSTKPRMDSSVNSNTSNLNLLLDVTMSLTVELGRTTMSIRDVLQLSEGSVVELDKSAGEELDLLVNGKLIGRGRLIVLDDYYGIQVTHIVDPMERLKI